MAIDRELRLQRRGLEEVAAGVKALMKARGLEEVKSIDLDSLSRGRQGSLEASLKTETTLGHSGSMLNFSSFHRLWARNSCPAR